MIERGVLPPMADAVDEAKDCLRIETTADDAAIAGLIVTAVLRCEAFVGRTLIERTMRETVAPMAAWRWLSTDPIRAVTAISALMPDGTETALLATTYEIDIVADGRARIRFLALPNATRVVVTFRAGSATSWRGVSAGLRQGIIRLAAHDYLYRDRADVPAMPTVVAALWLGERRMRLS